ncbi:GNAT family N-acetyltransferase [Nonomuraea sp. NPDC050790]|uniref:GNAT family N-acetyltransferase n=1 Tax=Nonomuraea sp. NPDC050790 TaxID=3364371 RepID=UPI0037B2E206
MFDAAVHAYLRSIAGEGARRAGPFTVRFDEHDDALPFNYAVPDDDVAPAPAEVGALITLFHEHARVPRLEYVPQAAPKVEAAVTAAGFETEGRYPLLVCTPEAVQSAQVDPAIEVAPVTTDEGLWQAARVMNAAFDAPDATEHDVARMRRILGLGGVVAVATDTTTGTPVGAGQIGGPHEGVAEVAGIAVATSHRRRGIAGAVTALLTRAGAANGITTAFLTPADDRAGRVYARVGYHKAGEMLHTSLR